MLASDLVELAQQGDTSALQNLLPTSAHGWPMPAMMWFAAANDHVGVLRLLLDQDANVNHENNDGVTSLYIACCNGCVEAVRTLLAAKACIRGGSKTGYCDTAASAAAFRGHADVLRALIQASADLETKNELSYTALHLAAVQGQSACVQHLVSARASIDSVSRYGHTPTFSAAHYGHYGTVKMLVQSKADVHRACLRGETPVFAAAHRGHCSIVQLLLIAKANASTANQKGATPASTAAAHGHSDVVAVLARAGCGHV